MEYHDSTNINVNCNVFAFISIKICGYFDKEGLELPLACFVYLRMPPMLDDRCCTCVSYRES